MGVVTAKKRSGAPATVADLLALPEADRYELVDGELLPKEAASGRHGEAQLSLAIVLQQFRRGGGRAGGPGGWLFGSEVLIQFSGGQIRRPDVAGWRREHLRAMPAEVPITVIPDWICEVLSTNRADDLVTKMRLYHQSKVPHYWLIDPEVETLAVYRWHEDGYLHVVGAQKGERVKAEPFDAIELVVGVLFGDDDEA
jgi:Uma2 family endonuclease